MEDEEFVDLVLDDGHLISVRALSLDPEREVAFERLQMRASELLSSLAPLASEVRKSISGTLPDEVTLTLKVGVAIESGKAVAVIGGGKIDSAIEVSLKWKS